MALREKKSLAIEMRQSGASYSQIKDAIGVSKASLSLWLHDMPLSDARIKELRDHSVVRIEKFRNTMRQKREARWAQVRTRTSKDIGALSKRDIFIAGLFLYWGEGGKTSPNSTSLSNTDPATILFFMRWLEQLGVPRARMKVHVHLYADMDIEKELKYWSKTLGLPRGAFRKPYVKSSNRSGLTYKQKFTHGTCNLIFENRDVAEYVSSALAQLRSLFLAGNEKV
jgi:hypothetical protein